MRFPVPALSRWRAFALVLVAAVALCACGSTFVTPAALVDGQRISQDALKHEVDQALASPQTRAQFVGLSGRQDLTRQVLASLIRIQLVREYAKARHITVTPSEVNAQLSQFAAQAGGFAQFQIALRQQGLTLAQARTIVGRNVLFSKVEADVASSGGQSGATQQQKDALFTSWLRQRFDRASIEVNPRFGKADDKAGTVAAITSTGQ